MRVVVLHLCTKFEIRPLAVRKIWLTMSVSINWPSDLHIWPFDLETGMWAASKVGNLPSKFGHARPLVSRIIRYVRDGRTYGRTDRQTDGWTKATHLPYERGHNKWIGLYNLPISSNWSPEYDRILFSTDPDLCFALSISLFPAPQSKVVVTTETDDGQELSLCGCSMYTHHLDC